MPVAPPRPVATPVIAQPDREEPSGVPAALNRAQAAREGGTSLRTLLQRLDVAYNVYEEALMYGVQHGWSCAGLLQQSRQARGEGR